MPTEQARLGLGNNNHIGDTPGEMPPADTNVGVGVVTKVGSSNWGSCVLFETGTLRCWGANSYGQLGRGHSNTIGNEPGEMPPTATNYGLGTVSGIYNASTFAQILLADGNVRDWGQGGTLGYGSGADIGDGPGEMPTNNVSLGGTVMVLSKGPPHRTAASCCRTCRCLLGWQPARTAGLRPRQHDRRQHQRNAAARGARVLNR